MITQLQEGNQAPAFELMGDDGQIHRLQDYKGQFVVLYFYPKDMTPGCTTEACDFNTQLADYQQHRATILGVSKDSLPSHARFKSKHGLLFTLLSDPDLAVHKAYGAYTDQGLWGKIGPGVLRSTFLIDPSGKLLKTWPNVRVKGHADAVLRALKEA